VASHSFGTPSALPTEATMHDPTLTRCLARYLAKNPHRRGETPSWLAIACWAEYDELEGNKPTPQDVREALRELREVRGNGNIFRWRSWAA
jgi:hypothetical protein